MQECAEQVWPRASARRLRFGHTSTCSSLGSFGGLGAPTSHHSRHQRGLPCRRHLQTVVISVSKSGSSLTPITWDWSATDMFGILLAPRSRSHCSAGFTLVELIISIVL
jgi:hypothetical protein